VVVKGAAKVVGRVVSEGEEVVVNPYNSTHPKMVFGVVRIPKGRVKKIEITVPSPEHEFQRRMAEATDADACYAIAEWCLAQKLKEQQAWALTVALRFDPDHAAARKALGAKAPRGNWVEQVQLARTLLAAPADQRGEAIASIRADRQYPFDERYLRRALRSQEQKRGLQTERPVALGADKLESGARYTLFVPEKYDPLQPTPLVIGLHGGGAGGADGKLVVGSGASAMNFYQQRCDARGWLCACPTALAAGWDGALNDALIDAIFDELAALYNIDENRVYLVGHSMGGGGTWVQGARLPERYAAVAPAASYGVRGIDAFGRTRSTARAAGSPKTAASRPS
jgi:acetyl esterase/lipase